MFLSCLDLKICQVTLIVYSDIILIVALINNETIAFVFQLLLLRYL